MVMPKSRYDSVDNYIALDPALRKEYNDNPLPIDEDIKQRLLDEGVSSSYSDSTTSA